MTSLNINSLNCRGLKDWHKRQFITDFFRVKHLDICFLQETHCTSKFNGHSWGKQWGGKCFWSFGTNHSKGVGIWFRDGLNFKVLSQYRDTDGRLLSLLVQFGMQIIKLATIYAPVNPKERKVFFSKIPFYLKGKHPIILGGDFNCVTDVKLDKRGGSALYGEFGSENLKEVCNDLNLIDLYRQKYGSKQEYTWQNSLGNTFIRLDRFYVSKNLLNKIVSVTHVHIPQKVSDHSCVQLVFNINFKQPKETGPGFWKCNVNVLQDKYFQDDFALLWNNLDNKKDQSAQWWEECKLEFKHLIIAHSTRLSYIRNEKQKQARKYLTKLLQSENISENEINIARNEIDKLYEESIEGIKIRAKVKYLEINEKPTRFFLQKEKKSALNKCITKLIKSDGTIIDTNEEIQEECAFFYKSLYSSEQIDNSLESYFFKDLPTLTSTSTSVCEGEITLEECEKAIKLMSNLKTPGVDGLPKEFYVFAFKYIGKSFVRLINRCWHEGLLPSSQRRGLITLLCKNPDQPDNLQNWRPITLLNTDYKILSKVLTLRLRKIIGEIIHPDQTCSIPDRTIQDNVHLIRNLIEYVNGKNMSAAIISLDQSKAFDRVSHEYLFNVLSHLGFGPQFISLVKLLYKNINSSVLVNGFISTQFPVQRSVRQGCSLSPLLYVLCIEPFAHRIRMDPMIKGIPLPGTAENAKISQYADDTNLFVTDLVSVRKILILVELYELASGAKLNKQKTFGMWLGKWRGRLDQPFGLHWTSNYNKFYGVYLGNIEGHKKTWDKVITKFEKCVYLYSRRDLSFRGRSVILKAVLCSSIWYVGSLILMPQSVEKRLNKLLFTFLWNSQPEALKREMLLNDFPNGGLNVIDIKTKIESFLVKQVLQLFNGSQVKWKYLAIYWIGLHLREYVPSFASLSIPHAERIPDYYRYALRLFRKFVELVPTFMAREVVTTQFIYLKLLELRKMPPKVLKVFPTIAISNAWEWVQCPFVDPKYRDLAWRIVHQIIPTQSLLYKYNITRNAKCYLCKCGVETISHLFYECPLLYGLWPFVENTLFLLTGSQVKITLTAIRFNVFKPHAIAHYNDLLVLLVNILKFCIWTKRNQSKHEFKKVSTLCIKALFIRTLTLRIKADFVRFDNSKFSKYWCRNNSITRIDGNSIIILLRLHPP